MKMDIISRIAVIGLIVGITCAGAGCAGGASSSGQEEPVQEEAIQEQPEQEQVVQEEPAQDQATAEQAAQEQAEYVDVYAEDEGFYTKALKTNETEWREENGIHGGLYIYTGYSGGAPFVQICRCESESDPEVFLTGELDEFMRELIQLSGSTLLEVGDVSTYTAGSREIPSVLYIAKAPEEQGPKRICYLNLAAKEKDEATGEPCLIRFCAVWRESDQEEESTERANTLMALEEAVAEFTLKHKAEK